MKEEVKMLKKILSCILIAIVALTCFSGCNDDGIPDGMYSATVEGEPFILYVPEGWTDNRDSGISSAYYSLVDAVTVSARYYSPDTSGDFTLDAYIDAFASSFADSNPSFKVIDRKSAKLGDKAGVRYQYSFDRSVEGEDGEKSANVTATQYYAQHAGDVIVLSLYCKTSEYDEEYAAMFEQIRSEFVFCDKKAVNDVVTDKKTPAGMKKASFKNCEYVFYVPTSWYCDMSDKLSEAYYPESGKPNVTVTSFSPDNVMTAKEYFSECEEIYKKDISGYERIGESERTVAELSAISYTYKAVYGGTEYRIMQTVFVYNDMVYSITYTALADRFDAHLDHVKTMLNTFRFR